MKVSLQESYCTYDPDVIDLPAMALNVDVAANESEMPVHQHRKGQLVLALRGGVTCEVSDALWMVPPQCGVWIPGGMLHSNHATPNARICFLFVEPGAINLPNTCCTLSVSPLVREMILYLAGIDPQAGQDSHIRRLMRVLLDELARMPVEHLHWAISSDPKIRHIAQALVRDPADRSNLAQWADRVAMSERSLARLIVKETGLSFGRWRQQLHLIVALRELAAGMSVQQVSAELGYESVTAFITMFKKSLGRPPAQYFSALKNSGE
ncbi:MAG: helix-turn-helix transcriptional regulator [Pseudomonadota bacterium]